MLGLVIKLVKAKTRTSKWIKLRKYWLDFFPQYCPIKDFEYKNIAT